MKITALISLASIFSGESFLAPTRSLLDTRCHRSSSNYMADKDVIPHSSIYLDEESRNYWWNNDFLHLMSKRWGFGKVDKVLDVGCGVGHWGRVLSSVLPNECKIIGIDKESSWIDQATKISHEEGTYKRLSYQLGDVYSIPFSNAVFDVVTCQTLLIHVPDVKKAISEMLRVLKPYGKIIVAEPNNLVNNLLLSSHDLVEMEEKFEIAKFQYICEKGKMFIGEGFNSLGDLLPGIFKEMGLEDINVYISDKTFPFMPPYNSKEEITSIKQLKKSIDENYWIWSKTDTQRYFLAGGGENKDFEALWIKSINQMQRFLKGIKEKTLHTAGGNVIYCISGVKI